MSYLDQLKKSFKVPAGEPKETKELPKPNCLGFLGSPVGQFEKIEAGEPANDPTRTAWRWLIHFSDRNPLEVAFSPEATHGEVLDCYPDALAAEPIEPGRRQPGAPLAGDQETEIRSWLAAIGETDQATIAEVLIGCRQDEDVRRYLLDRTGEIPAGG